MKIDKRLMYHISCCHIFREIFVVLQIRLSLIIATLVQYISHPSVCLFIMYKVNFLNIYYLCYSEYNREHINNVFILHKLKQGMQFTRSNNLNVSWILV